MRFRKSLSEEHILRIEEEQGGAVTFLCREDTGAGQLLSIDVPEENRRKHIGTNLLLTAEKELSEKGFSRMEADFTDEGEVLAPFFQSAGFEVHKGVPLFSVDMKKLLCSVAVRKALKCRTGSGEFVPVSELFLAQMDDLEDTLAHFGLRDGFGIEYFSQDLSGVVYNEALAIKAMVLCTEGEDFLRVDFLLGMNKKESAFILAALREMLLRVVKMGGYERYQRLEIVAANEITGTLLSRVLDKGYSPERRGETWYAIKTPLSGDGAGAAEEVEAENDDLWQEEIRRIPFQENIWWKVSWHRNQESEKNKVHFTKE